MKHKVLKLVCIDELIAGFESEHYKKYVVRHKMSDRPVFSKWSYMKNAIEDQDDDGEMLDAYNELREFIDGQIDNVEYLEVYYPDEYGESELTAIVKIASVELDDVTYGLYIIQPEKP